eukprot:15438705-Alexandrium_andersonii.AAC.1
MAKPSCVPLGQRNDKHNAEGDHLRQRPATARTKTLTRNPAAITNDAKQTRKPRELRTQPLLTRAACSSDVWKHN